MSVSNGITLPYSIANGQTNDATQVMANYNTLLLALNRALLDAGGGSGVNAFGSQLHNLGAGSASGDAVNLGQLAGYLPLTGGTMTGALAATSGLTAATQTAGDNSAAAATTAFVQNQFAAFLAGNPAFTGAPTAPTAAPGTNTTQIATTAFALANGSPLGTTYSAPTRVLGTAYTAGTKGRFVIATFSGSPSVGATTFTVSVAGNNIAVGYVAASGPANAQNLMFYVPPGATYSVTAGSNNPGSAAITSWWEI